MPTMPLNDVSNASSTGEFRTPGKKAISGFNIPGLTHAPPVALKPSTHRPTVDPAPRAADAAAKSSGLEHAPRRSTASTSASETRARVAVRVLATIPTRRGAAPCLRVCRARDRTLSGGEKKRVFAATSRVCVSSDAPDDDAKLAFAARRDVRASMRKRLYLPA